MENPISRIVFARLIELRDLNKRELENTILNNTSISNIDLHLLSELKGKVRTLNEVLNIESLLNDIIQEENKDVSGSWSET